MAVTAFVTLGSYRETLLKDYRPTREDQLVIQETQSFAEFYGSRLSPEIAVALEDLGFPEAVVEIHAIVGTSLENAVLLKGVDLARDPELDFYVIRAGRGLEPGDPPRRAMIGTRLADRLGAVPGDTIQLRGRPFEVIGVFETGSYTENEAAGFRWPGRKSCWGWVRTSPCMSLRPMAG